MTPRDGEQDPIAWMAKAACKGANPDLFYWVEGADVNGQPEPDYPSMEAKWYCNRCEVSADCLSWALDKHEVGVWGGTSSYQRSLLGRQRQRRHCPGCGSDEFVTESKHEICLACGLSWAY